MDTVEAIKKSVQSALGELGTGIIQFADLAQGFMEDSRLSPADRERKISAARDILTRKMESAFGEGEHSIKAGIERIFAAGGDQQADRGIGLKARGIWEEELPDLRRYLEYCTDLIAAHPGETCREVRQGQKCLTEATVVLDKISSRVERAVRNG